MENNILNFIGKNLIGKTEETFSFGYPDSEGVIQTRVVRVVQRPGDEYTDRGTQLGGGTSWHSESRDSKTPAWMVVKPEKKATYVRAFPTTADHKGVSEHEKVFDTSKMSNIRIHTTLKEVHGNLIDLANEGKFDVILQGCNCICVMGSGLAGEIAARIPQAVTIDNKTGRNSNKIGTFSVVPVKGNDKHKFVLLNCYTQAEPSYDGKDVFEYKGFREICQTIAIAFAGKRIGIPLIGCGLAGGDFARIKGIITEELGHLDVTIVHFKK